QGSNLTQVFEIAYSGSDRPRPSRVSTGQTRALFRTRRFTVRVVRITLPNTTAASPRAVWLFSISVSRSLTSNNTAPSRQALLVYVQDALGRRVGSRHGTQPSSPRSVCTGVGDRQNASRGSEGRRLPPLDRLPQGISRPVRVGMQHSGGVRL